MPSTGITVAPIREDMIETPRELETGSSEPPWAGSEDDQTQQDQTKGKVSRPWARWFTSISDRLTQIGQSQLYLDSPGFASTDFVSSGGGSAWTMTNAGGELQAFSTRLYGDTMDFIICILPGAGSTVTAGATSLQVLLPTRPDGKYQLNEQGEYPCFLYEGSATPIVGKVVLAPLAFPDRLFFEHLNSATAFAAGQVGLSVQVRCRVTFLPYPA
jgi:hypothetical protein